MRTETDVKENPRRGDVVVKCFTTRHVLNTKDGKVEFRRMERYEGGRRRYTTSLASWRKWCRSWPHVEVTTVAKG